MLAAMVGRCNKLTATKQIPPLLQNYSRKSSSINNYYIRKRRKWPIQPYKHLYTQRFAFKLAIHSFKQSINNSTNNLLPIFLNSFSIYQIDPTPQSFHFLLKLSIKNHCFHSQIPLILDHIEKVENFETPEWFFIDLIEFYGKIFMMVEAVEIFFRMVKFRCVPSVDSLNALLLVLCRNRKGLEIVPFVLRESNVRIEESSFSVLIRALCRIGKVSYAYQLLCCMVDQGFSADQKLLSLILEAKCDNKESGEIKGFLWDLKMLGFEPKKEDFCNVIRCLVQKGKGKSALEVLRQMKVEGVKPEVTCYNLVLEGLFADKLFSRAEKVFDELLVLGLVPDAHTYNVYIWGLCLQNKVDEGMKILGSMEDLGCEPTLNTHISILASLCEAGKLDRVREVMDSMSHKRVQMNSVAYEIMIDCLVCNGDIDGACNFLNEMLDKRFVPKPAVLDKIICWLCKNNLYVKAVELFEGMIAKDIAPGSKAWESLIQGSGTTFNLDSFVNLVLLLMLRYNCTLSTGKKWSNVNIDGLELIVWCKILFLGKVTFTRLLLQSVRSAQQGKIKCTISFLNLPPSAKDIILKSNFE